MVKCQGLNEDGGPCGVDLLPDVKFCPECGTRVHKVIILEKPKDTVPCPGTDDGNPCSNKELVQGQKFCFSCAWRVNQSIFEPGSRVCEVDRQGTRCTGIIRKHETTCPICTSDKGAAPTAVQKDCVSDNKSVDQTESPADSKPVDQTQSPDDSKSVDIYKGISDKNGKAVPEVQSDKNSDCYDPKQMSNKFQSSINNLQKNEKSSEDQYGESEKIKGNDYHHRDSWEPPTYSILGHKVHTQSEPSPKGDDAASVVKPKPQSDLNEAVVTGSGDGPTQKPVSEEDDQGESVTASVSSGPILQHPPEDNSNADTGSSQKGIFNFTGSSRQKITADVWQKPDERFGEGSRSEEVKDDQLFGDNSPPAAEELKPVGEALKESSLFSSVKESKPDSLHTSSNKSSKDMEVDPKMTDTASAVSKSDEDSGSSNDEDVDEDDNSLNQKEGEAQKMKNKNNSGKKSRRVKKKARKGEKKRKRRKRRGQMTYLL